jgi:hypothetical protein
MVHKSLPADSHSLRRIASKPPAARAKQGVPLSSEDLVTRWMLWLLELNPAALRSVGRRLVFRRREMELALAAAALFQGAGKWARWRASRLTLKLDRIPLSAIEVVHAALPAGRARKALESYLHSWRHMRPHTTGSDLRELGLKPGPRYRAILQSLRAAWIDGTVQDAQGERQLLDQMMRRAASRHFSVPNAAKRHA